MMLLENERISSASNQLDIARGESVENKRLVNGTRAGVVWNMTPE